MFSLKFFLVFAAVSSFAKVDADKDGSATVLSYRNEKLDDGYIYEYITSNGISGKETGQFSKDTQSKNPEDVILRVTGFYSYTDAAGKNQRVDYTADENGFVAKSNISPGTKAYSGTAYSAPALPVQATGQVSSYPAPKSYEGKGISSHVLASLGGN
ncbi:hypothetical protein WA026_003510 [Henosepilachna vigintioctopunctata]|uniref:Uncharacterized protein n=1 Tax=Henosepilachna vigintioctopunctata TaxID=420089 RepID=A0AAW1TN27_9CUCU